MTGHDPRGSASETAVPLSDKASEAVTETTTDAVADAESRDKVSLPVEINGPKGPEPTRFGDWEKGGRCSDF